MSNCGPTEPTNPKTDVFGTKASKQPVIYRLQNPIANEIRDLDDLASVFTTWNFIPYAGTTEQSGHSLLTWYLTLAKHSTTNAACIAKKIKFAVGGKAIVTRAADPEFSTGEDLADVSVNEAKTYVDAIKETLSFTGGVSEFHGRLGWQYEATGNGFVELSVSTIMGQTRCAVSTHRTTNAMFVKTAAGDAKMVAISPIWTKTYLDEYPPRIVPIFPVYAQGEDGVLRTMFHLKSGDNSWYGRPPSEGGDLYKYREFQDAMYQIRAAGSDFTGQLIIEVEDDNPEFDPAIDEENAVREGHKGFASRLEKNFTNKGDDPQSVLITSRPFGSSPMFVFQIEQNTREDWYKVTGEISESKIIRSHNLTHRFMGLEASNGFSSDVYLWDYILNMEPIINEFRATITDFVNKIISEVWRLTGQSELDQYSLSFSAPIQSTLDEFKSASASVNTNPAPETTEETV
ncbi:MAG: hypothetical protein ACRCVX_14205 [Shewanella sp.]